MTAIRSKWGDREARREDILTAARACLVEQGLQAHGDLIHVRHARVRELSR